MDAVFAPFREVWAVDFEFTAPPGARPVPICVVARDLRSGRVERVWLADGPPPPAPPYPTGPGVLFVAYYASAELGCHLALGWPMPARILDLFAEFKARTNGTPTPSGAGLLGALAFFGLDGLAAAEKEEMRQLAIRGGPFTPDERQALLEYCQSDVDALARLLPAMAPQIDLPRGLLRGRFMAAAARVERQGVPVDVPVFTRLRANWDRVKARLVRAVNPAYGVFAPGDPSDPDGPWSFSSARFEAYLARTGLPWPRLETGRLALDDDTFREMAKTHPAEIAPLRDLRHALSDLKLNKLAVGPDGRNRVMLSAFGSRTGRNQPRSGEFIFGPSAWLRSLIRPGPGRAVAYTASVGRGRRIGGRHPRPGGRA